MDNETNVSHRNADESDNVSDVFEFNTRRKVLLALDVLIFIVGFVGNGSVIFLTLRHKGLRTVPNLLITNLAFGDLMVIITVVLVNILHPLLPEVHPHSFQFCEFFYFVQFMSLGVSVFTLTALSVDRYTTVAFPMYKQRIARSLTVWTVVVIWIVSISICVPWFTLINDKTCWFESNGSSASYLISLILLLYILPAFVMIFCYLLTAKNLLCKNLRLNLDPKGASRQQRTRSRLAVIGLVITIVFIVCSTLIYVWLITFYFSPTNSFANNQVVKELKSLLNKINSIINPIILYLMSTAHRRYFMYQFCFSEKRPLGRMAQHAQQFPPYVNGFDVAGQRDWRVGSVLSRMTPVREDEIKI